jgi:hypothetical protein
VQKRKHNISEFRKTSWWILYKKTTAVYSEIHKKHINALQGQNVELLIIKAGGTYAYHWALKG